MIDVIVADHQELFRIGMAEVLAVAADVRIVSQPQSTEQLLSALKVSTPHVLVLSSSFLPAFWKIQRLLKRRQTALLVLTEEHDRVAYVRWLRAQGVVYRSMDAPVIVDAMLRVARGELFVQDRSSDMTEEQPEGA
jgi:DNA-binding NarL/FixJ family response regulator